MRQFKLINHDGQTYDLTVTTGLFFYNVGGLGTERDAGFQRIGENFEIIRDRLAQGVITGTIRFVQPGAYKAYFDFAQFCQDAPLRMAYTPEHHTFYRDGYVTSIEKSESAEGALRAVIEFKATTPWYKTVYEYNEGTVTTGKRYNYRYNYTYANTVAQSIIINSDSYQPSPMKLIIFGYAENPTWRHYVNNVLQTTGKVNGVIEEGRKLVIDTTQIPYTIRQYDLSNNIISDMYQQSDFSTYRFIRLGRGVNTISVQHEALSIVKMAAEARIEYATV